MDLQDTQVYANQVGSRKANVTEDMAKKAKENAKKPNFIVRILNGIGGRIKRLISGRPFDEIIEELNSHDLSEDRKAKLIRQAEKRIEKMENFSWVRDNMTDEEKEIMLARKEQKIAEMKEKLKLAKGEKEENFIPIPEINNPNNTDEEPKTDESEVEKDTTKTEEQSTEEGNESKVEEDTAKTEEPSTEEGDEPEVEEDAAKTEEQSTEENEEPEVEEDTAKPEEPSTEEMKNEVNDNLEDFANYGEYVSAFIEEKIALEDRAKAYANILEDKLPAGMLSRRQFYEERKNQIFQKKQREYEEKTTELKREISERERELRESKDFFETALGKIVEQEKELLLLKDEAADLERKLFDESTANTNLEQEKNDLISKVKERENVIQKLDKEKFSLQRRGDKAEAAKERAEQTIEKLEDKISELREKLAKKRQEIAEKDARYKKMEQNIKIKLDTLTPEADIKRLEAIDDSKMDELEKTAVEYRKQQLVKEIEEVAKAEEKSAELEKVAEEYVKEDKKASKKTTKGTKKTKATSKKEEEKASKKEDKKASKKVKSKKAPKHLKVEAPVKEEVVEEEKPVQVDIKSQLESLAEAREKLKQLQELEGIDVTPNNSHKR